LTPAVVAHEHVKPDTRRRSWAQGHRVGVRKPTSAVARAAGAGTIVRRQRARGPRRIVGRPTGSPSPDAGRPADPPPTAHGSRIRSPGDRQLDAVEDALILGELTERIEDLKATSGNLGEVIKRMEQSAKRIQKLADGIGRGREGALKILAGIAAKAAAL
jgi:hypothetical protein